MLYFEKKKYSGYKSEQTKIFWFMILVWKNNVKFWKKYFGGICPEKIKKKFCTTHKKSFATLGKTKAPPPPPLFMLNGRSLMLICMISLKTVYDV